MVSPSPGEPARNCGTAASGWPQALGEAALTSLLSSRADADAGGVCFIGAGGYDHHRPACLKHLAAAVALHGARPPGAGTLQVSSEYRAMVARLMAHAQATVMGGGGARALCMAVEAALALRGGARRIVMSAALNPAYQCVLRQASHERGFPLVEMPFCRESGRLVTHDMAPFEGCDAIIVQQPNFFGMIEDAAVLTDRAHASGMIVIALVNPLLMALLAPPGHWGAHGADIAVADAQTLGLALGRCGALGLLSCSSRLAASARGTSRDLPWERTAAVDFPAPLLWVSALHLAVMGPEGLHRAARASCSNARYLAARLRAVDGVKPVFNGPFANELALHMPLPAADVVRALAAHNVLAGHALGRDDALSQEALLVCATELRTRAQMDRYAELLSRVVASRTAARCPVQPKMR